MAQNGLKKSPISEVFQVALTKKEQGVAPTESSDLPKPYFCTMRLTKRLHMYKYVVIMHK